MAASGTQSMSRLRQLAQGAERQRAAEQEHCDLCGESIPAQHRHLLDLSTRELMCACQACRLLFDRGAAGGGHYRLVPDRRLRLVDLRLDDVTWEGLRVPVDMAFFFLHSEEGRARAFYPGPMGATESLLELEAWQGLERDNPVLSSMAPDVEALLVDRARGARRQWLVGIDECYALVGLIRTRWRGLTGGTEVWRQIGAFLDELDGRSRPTRRDEEATCST
jgi:Family of unknown function (DUF5947)